MATYNYGTLKRQIEATLNNGSVDDIDTIDGYAYRGMVKIQRDIPTLPFLLKTNVTPVGPTTGTYVVKPTDYLRMKTLMVNMKPLLKVGEDRFFKLYNPAAVPEYYTDLGDRFLIGGQPPEGAEISLRYYAEMKSPESDADSNEIIRLMPDLLIYAAVVEAGKDLLAEESILNLWNNTYQELRAQIQNQIDEDAHEGMMTVEAPLGEY
jgi:hypothetical protein